MHTPAPWIVVGNDIEGDGMTVVTITEHQRMTPRQQDNACLIAAAPDLLAFAQAVAAYPGADAGLVIAARAAIAKALGE